MSCCSSIRSPASNCADLQRSNWHFDVWGRRFTPSFAEKGFGHIPGRLAAENAWFLSESTSTYGLAGLSCSDTAEQLIAILIYCRSAIFETLVLRAISVGDPLACFRPQLEHILAT